MGAVHAFFDNYRATFARLDRDVLLEQFAFPFHVVSETHDAVDISVWDRDDWGPVLDGLLGAYRSLGVVDAEPLALEVAEVTPRLFSARVHWELQREDGSAVYDFVAVYTVVDVGGTFRAVGIAHNELPELTAAMAGTPNGE